MMETQLLEEVKQKGATLVPGSSGPKEFCWAPLPTVLE